MDRPRLYPPSLLDQSFGLCISPQDLLLPYYNFPSIYYYRPWKWYMQKSKDFGSTISEEKDKFKICLDVQHFQPSEINVKVAGTEVVIEGNHEERKDDHGFISRRFKRRYTLPKDCNSDSVVSSLSSDGVLIVTADKTRDQGKKEIIVPIKMCSNVPNKETVKPAADAPLTSKPVETIKKETIKPAADAPLTSKPVETIKKETIKPAADAPLTSKPVETIKKETVEPAADAPLTSKPVETIKKETVKPAADAPLTSKPVETIKQVVVEAKGVDTEADKKKTALMLKEDHCRLLKPELLGEAAATATEKASVQAIKGVSDLLSMNTEKSSKVAQSGQKTVERCEFSNEKSSAAKLESVESIAGASRQSESCFIKNLASETTEVQQSSSSYSSSMTSSLKETTEKINEIVSDISAQLKEAAENM